MNISLLINWLSKIFGFDELQPYVNFSSSQTGYAKRANWSCRRDVFYIPSPNIYYPLSNETMNETGLNRYYCIAKHFQCSAKKEKNYISLNLMVNCVVESHLFMRKNGANQFFFKRKFVLSKEVPANWSFVGVSCFQFFFFLRHKFTHIEKKTATNGSITTTKSIIRNEIGRTERYRHFIEVFNFWNLYKIYTLNLSFDNFSLSIQILCWNIFVYVNILLCWVFEGNFRKTLPPYQNIVINLMLFAYKKNSLKSLENIIRQLRIGKTSKNELSDTYYDININNIPSFNDVSRIILTLKNVITLF